LLMEHFGADTRKCLSRDATNNGFHITYPGLIYDSTAWPPFGGRFHGTRAGRIRLDSSWPTWEK
jgi:hypothetical protein